MTEKMENLFRKLSTSPFRSRFHLTDIDRKYIREKGMAVIRQHAEDFITKRLAPAEPSHDGRQTPMRGHPVFIAQHATATCCRQCLFKWHHIQPHIPLSETQQIYIVDIIMCWIEKENGAC